MHDNFNRVTYKGLISITAAKSTVIDSMHTDDGEEEESTNDRRGEGEGRGDRGAIRAHDERWWC
jgi:hypothetical protein